MSRSLRLGLAAAVVLALLAGGVFVARRGGAVTLDARTQHLDLARPDALIERCP